MSGMNSTAATQVQVIREIYTGYEADVGMLALPVWEYCITFDQEVTTVWQAKKFSAASFILLFARYGMLLEVLIEGLRVFLGISFSSCKVSIISLETLSLLSYIVIALLSALRVSAMWDRNYIIFFVIFTLGLTPVATDIFYVSHYKYSHIGKPLPMSCSASPDIVTELYQTLTIVTRVSLIMMESIILILTWMKTYSQIRSARRLKIAAPIVICLARDGTVYFVVLLAMNIVQMLLGASLVDTIGGFMAALPPILLNRFIVNLRQAMDPLTPGSNTDIPTRISEIAFRRSDTMFANLGEPLMLAYGQSQGIADEYEDHCSGPLLSFDDSHSGCMRFASRSQSVEFAARRGVVESPVSSGVLVLSDSKHEFGLRTPVDKIDSATIC